MFKLTLISKIKLKNIKPVTKPIGIGTKFNTTDVLVVLAIDDKGYPVRNPPLEFVAVVELHSNTEYKGVSTKIITAIDKPVDGKVQTFRLNKFGDGFKLGHQTCKHYGKSLPSLGVLTGLTVNGANPQLPVGHIIGVARSGGTHIYPMLTLRNTAPPLEWTDYSCELDAATTLRRYTSTIRLGFLVNRDSQNGNIQAFTNIQMRRVQT